MIQTDHSEKRFKILFLIDAMLVGGAEKSLLEIIRRFNTTDVVFCHIYPGAPLKPVFEAAGIRVVSLNVPGKYSFSSAIRSVLKVVRDEQPDMIHATLYRACIVSRFVARFSRIPLINSFVNETYGPERYRGFSPLQRLKRDGLKILDRSTAPMVNLFIANSQTIAGSNAHYLHVPRHKVKTVYRGRSVVDYLPNAEVEKVLLRQNLGVSPDARVLLCVSRFWSHKRHVDLIRALSEVLVVVPKTFLVFAGDGPERQRLQELARTTNVADRVFFLGVRHDIPALLQIADATITASEYEGLPGAVIEAMLASRPVILSRIGVHEEMVEDRVDGLFFNTYDFNDLANKIIEILSDRNLADSIARNAYEKARERYDVVKIAARYEELYAEVLRESRNG